jgi:hypothetical protein
MSNHGVLKSTILMILIITGLTFPAISQSDTCWTALLVKKGKKLVVRKNMSTLNGHGFYLCRNEIVDIKPVTGERFTSSLIDIKQDTLIFEHEGDKKLSLNYKSIEALYFPIDAPMGLFLKIAFNDYDIFFKKTIDCIPKPEKPDTTYWKTFICFIPPMEIKVNEINGLALGFIAAPSNYRDSLKINGLCIELLPAGLIAPFFGSFLGSNDLIFSEMPDSRTVNIKGATLSSGGVVMEVDKLSGFYLGAGTTWVNTLVGFSLTGVNTIAAESKGVSISGLRSQIRKVGGVQISLFNSCVELHGVQIGLLNISQKRTTMFFNWAR